MNSIQKMAEYACNHLALFIFFTINNSSYLTALSPILQLAKQQILTRQSLFQSSESNSEQKKKAAPPKHASCDGYPRFLLPLIGVQTCLSLAEPGPLPAYMNNMTVTLPWLFVVVNVCDSDFFFFFFKLLLVIVYGKCFL